MLSFTVICIVTTICVANAFTIHERDAETEPLCGQSSMLASHAVSRRVYYGDTATDGQFPWFLSLSLGYSHACGAAVYNKQWVVTAKHCVVTTKDGPISDATVMRLTPGVNVYLDSTVAREHELEARVEKIIIHPNSVVDFALLKLDRELEYNSRLSPPCIPTAPIENGSVIILSGQGGREKGSIKGLKYTPLYVIKTHPEKYDFVASSGPDSNSSSCSGDSGGPSVQLREVNGRQAYVLVGTVSAAAKGKCGDYVKWTIFDDVYELLPWIKLTLWLESIGQLDAIN